MTNRNNNPIDSKKRQTLKGMAAVAGAAAIGIAPSLSAGDQVTTTAAKSVRQVWPPIATQSPLAVTTRISAANNDVELVLTNTGDTPVTLTQLNPAKVTTHRGSFELADVLADGPRQLTAGETLAVPLQQHAVAINNAPDNARSVDTIMRTGLTVTTDANEFAAVSYAVVA